MSMIEKSENTAMESNLMTVSLPCDRAPNGADDGESQA